MREPEVDLTYRRDAFTWTAFGALFAFGYLNAVLGPSLPYLRAAEDLSYLVGALHQIAFSVGAGIAGALSARGRAEVGRRAGIAGGLVGAGLAGLAVAYGARVPLTLAGAGLMGLLATFALIRVWAAVADAHGRRRAVAMTEGEVAVSLAGIVAPLVIGAVAAGAATWRLAFPVGLALSALAALAMLRADVPATTPAVHGHGHAGRIQPTLVVIGAIVALEFALSFWLASYLDDDVGLRRDVAVALVSVLYAANLVGRLLASRLARAHPPERLLLVAFAVVLAGLPGLLAASSLGAAVAGIAVAGAGVGALFPLAAALHVARSPRTADRALGQILTAAAPGQVVGPLAAGLIAEAADLRAGLLVVPALALAAAGVLLMSRRPPRGRGRIIRDADDG